MLGNNPQMLRLLVRHGADVNATDTTGMTPLHWACEKRAVTRMVDALLALGAHVDAAEYGLTPLELVLNSQHKELLAYNLIQHGARTDAVLGAGFMTPLHRACMSGRMAQFLIRHGADPNARCGDGMTPLFIAIGAGNEYAMERLVRCAEVELDAANDFGETPLMVACENGNDEFARVLIEHGADVSVERSDGATPLTLAYRNGHHAVAYVVTSTTKKVLLKKTKKQKQPKARIAFKKNCMFEIERGGR